MSKNTHTLFTRNAQRLCAVSLAAALAASAMLAGCANSSAANNTANMAAPTAATSVAKDIDLSALDLKYTDRDKDASYDEASAVKVSLQGASATVEGSVSGVAVDGSTVTISKEGVYVFSGTLDDGQIVVECNKEDKAKVQIVLNGVSITNNDGPAIRVNQAKKCFITLAANTNNTLSDGADYKLDADSDEPYAALYSKDDLTLQGSGSLTVSANYRHGIACKDNLVITGGTYVVNAVEDAVRGNDSIKICDGSFDLKSGEDALKANNDEDATAGFISIDGGTFRINAGDDAVHAETALIVNDGDVAIEQCYEGLEAQQVYVNGGTVDLVASDDGVNATSGGSNEPGQRPGGPGMASGESQSNVFIKMTGGVLHVNAEGDGLDANGSLEITGGTIYVDGPTNSGNGALDYDGSATISGGTVIAVGSSGMAESFTGGTQPFAMANVSGGAGSLVQLKDASGNVLASMIAAKQFANVVVSAGVADGAICTIEVDGNATEVTMSTQPSEGAGMRGPGRMGDSGGSGGEGPGGMHGGRPAR